MTDMTEDEDLRREAEHYSRLSQALAKHLVDIDERGDARAVILIVGATRGGAMSRVGLDDENVLAILREVHNTISDELGKVRVITDFDEIVNYIVANQPEPETNGYAREVDEVVAELARDGCPSCGVKLERTMRDGEEYVRMGPHAPDCAYHPGAG